VPVRVQEERPTSVRLEVSGGAGLVRPPARAQAVTSAAAPEHGYRVTWTQPRPLTEAELFAAYGVEADA
jgi:hypothetical protein